MFKKSSPVAGGPVAAGASAAPLFQSPEAEARRQKSLILRVVRFAFFTLMVTFTLLAALRARAEPEALEAQYWVYVIAAVLFMSAALAVDLLTPNKKIATLSGLLFGLLGGLLAALAFGLVIDLVLESWVPNSEALKTLIPVVNSIKVLMGIALCYLGITTILQTQDDFRLAIPYVEFVKQLRGPRPLMLDSSALIDARIVDIAGTNLIQSPIIVPAFVVNELQLLADSADGLKRARGRRGLDVIARLQRATGLEVTIDETRGQSLGVDAQLVELAQRFQGMIVTSDVALGRIAGIKQVPVLNLNDLASALRPNLVPGEQLTLKIIKHGEQHGQGVGYLPDGTMVVAEDGGGSIGQMVTLTVGSALQTSAGRLIFGRIGALAKPAAGEGETDDGERANEGSDEGANHEPGEPDSAGRTPESPMISGTNDDRSAGAPGTSATTAGGPGIPRTPFPPRAPKSIRSGTPRNPRR